MPGILMPSHSYGQHPYAKPFLWPASPCPSPLHGVADYARLQGFALETDWKVLDCRCNDIIMNKNISSTTDLLAKIGAVISFVLLLIGSISQLISVGQNQQGIRVISIAVFLTYLTSSLWLAFKATNIKSVWRWTNLVIFYIVTILYFIWVGTWIKMERQPPIQSDIPLQIARRFDFEETTEPTDVRPWSSVPPSKSHTILVSNQPEFAHSGSNSLRLKVNMLSLDAGEDEYAGIALYDDNLRELGLQRIRLIEAWVLVPQSEQVQDTHLTSHIMAHTLDDSDNDIGLFSEDVELIPGKWVPIIIGLTYSGYTADNALDSKDGNISEFYLTIWSDQQYIGSIYIDDLTFYTDNTNLK